MENRSLKIIDQTNLAEQAAVSIKSTLTSNVNAHWSHEIVAANEKYEWSKNDMAQAINQSAFFIGIKEPLSEIELKLMVRFVTRYFTDISPKKLLLSVELAVAGILAVDVNHYQSFNPIYLKNILTAYRNRERELLEKKHREEQKNQIEVVLSVEEQLKGWAGVLYEYITINNDADQKEKPLSYLLDNSLKVCRDYFNKHELISDEIAANKENFCVWITTFFGHLKTLDAVEKQIETLSNTPF